MNSRSSNNRTKQAITLVTTFGILLAICLSVSVLAAKWVIYESCACGPEQPLEHGWLHNELGLSEKEAKAIDAFDDAYNNKRAPLLEEFNSRISYLGSLLANQETYSPEVNTAIHRIHEVHGELQEVSIQHYYEMLSILPPDKQEKLRRLAIKALSQPE